MNAVNFQNRVPLIEGTNLSYLIALNRESRATYVVINN